MRLREPEIIELQDFLNAMGAEISGAGKSVIIISGKKQLHGAEGLSCQTGLKLGLLILALAAVTGGEIFVKNAPSASMESFLQCIRRSGVKIDIQPDGIGVSAPPDCPHPEKLKRNLIPDFPPIFSPSFWRR